ncbi:MAG: hypothetical protein ACR2QK_22800 [Acidimicrobiales bacterium]
MGEPVTVIEKASSRPGYVRFDTNRTFTGMGHERYSSGEVIYGDRPPDEIARKLFETGKVDEVHVYAQSITVKLFEGAKAAGLKEIIEDIYIYYRPGVEVPTPESFAADS